MKSLLISTVAVLLVACSTPATENKVDVQKEIVEQPTQNDTQKAEESLDVAHFYPGANFMKVIVTSSALELDDAQNLAFKNWHDQNHSKVMEKIEAIKKLEGDMKSLSAEKASTADILAAHQKIQMLRSEIATTKSAGHAMIKSTLNSEQWTKVVEEYVATFPFNERSEKALRVAHINPVPNYMRAIRQGKVEGLNDEQKKNLATWSEVNAPKIVELGATIIGLEKEVYQKTLSGDESTLPTLFAQIEKARTEVVTLKTTCRDYLLSQLSEDQWKQVLEATAAN